MLSRWLAVLPSHILFLSTEDVDPRLGSDAFSKDWGTCEIDHEKYNFFFLEVFYVFYVKYIWFFCKLDIYISLQYSGS